MFCLILLHYFRAKYCILKQRIRFWGFYESENDTHYINILYSTCITLYLVQERITIMYYVYCTDYDLIKITKRITFIKIIHL